MILYKTGDVIADTGIIFLHELIQDSKLTSNYLEFEIEENQLSNLITTNILNNNYFPYVRNSKKYGLESKGNHIDNFNTLISITFNLLKNRDNQLNILSKYKPFEEQCIVCHQFHTTSLDISHEEKEVIRYNTKMNYSLMGSRNNTFNNYANDECQTCFVCEFLNLMFLLKMYQMNKHHDRKIIYSNDLLLNYHLNQETIQNYKEKATLKTLSKYNEYLRLCIFNSQKHGIILKNQFIINKDNILQQIASFDAIDRFNFSCNDLHLKDILKQCIHYNDFINIANNLFYHSCYNDNEDVTINANKTRYNIEIYLNYIAEIFK